MVIKGDGFFKWEEHHRIGVPFFGGFLCFFLFLGE